MQLSTKEFAGLLQAVDPNGEVQEKFRAALFAALGGEAMQAAIEEQCKRYIDDSMRSQFSTNGSMRTYIDQSFRKVVSEQLGTNYPVEFKIKDMVREALSSVTRAEIGEVAMSMLDERIDAYAKQYVDRHGEQIVIKHLSGIIAKLVGD